MPFLAWTVRTATVMTAIRAAEASGVRRPSASRRPPPASARPARKACCFAGFMPIESKKPAVPGGEGVLCPGFNADGVKEPGRPGQPMPAEPAEQLLRAVAHEEQAHDDA